VGVVDAVIARRGQPVAGNLAGTSIGHMGDNQFVAFVPGAHTNRSARV
jgi:hypothetical protein